MAPKDAPAPETTEQPAEVSAHDPAPKPKPEVDPDDSRDALDRAADEILAVDAKPPKEKTPEDRSAAITNEDLEAAEEPEEAPAEPGDDPAAGLVYNHSVGRWQDPTTGLFVPTPEGAVPPPVPIEGSEDAPAAEEDTEEPAQLEESEDDEPADPAPAQLETIRLPGRGPDDPDEEWEVDDPELVKSINRLRNGYMRGERYSREVEALHTERQALADDHAEVEQTLYELKTRPELFVQRAVTEESRPRVVRSLLLGLPDEQYQELVREIEDWESDPRAREVALLKTQNETREAASQADRHVYLMRKGMEAARKVDAVLRSYVPEDAAGTREAEYFLTEARQRLDRAFKANGITWQNLDLEMVHDIIAYDARAAGFGRPNGTPTGRGNGREGGSQTARTTPSDERVEAGKRTSRRFAAKASRRRALASAPAGAGAQPVKRTPPKGQTVDERADYLLSSLAGSGGR